MTDQEEKTRRTGTNREEIPRRGYDRRRDTGTYDEYAPRPGTPPPPMRGRKKERLPRDSGLYLPWWSLLILIVFVGAATIGVLLVVMNLSTVSLGNQTPQYIIVTNAYQPTQNLSGLSFPTGIPTGTPTSEVILPTIAATRTPLPGGCLLNKEVVVFNTGAVGLNLRSEPRLSGDVQFIAREGETLKVIDGPQYFDDIEWCKVENASRGIYGWASIDFLIAADAIATP